MSRNSLKKMLFNIIKIMTKKPEDMTLDEIREQMALFSRLYYHKRKEEDPEYIEKVRERKRITGKALYHKKKAEKEAKEAQDRMEKGEPEPEKSNYHPSRKYKTEYAMVAVAN